MRNFIYLDNQYHASSWLAEGQPSCEFLPNLNFAIENTCFGQVEPIQAFKIAQFDHFESTLLKNRLRVDSELDHPKKQKSCQIKNTS